MENTITNQTCALAALFQIADCVNELAHHGRAPADDIATLINSIFIENAVTPISIYEKPANLFNGLTVLNKQMNPSKQSTNINIARIIITLLVLERKLAKNTTMLDKIFAGIDRARQQAQHFESNTHENVLANLAALYADTISQINPKIMVTGEQDYLLNTKVVNKVRSLLLAGVRAAVLFHQLGGRRWHLLFRRKKYSQAAEHMLKNLDFSDTA